MGSQRPLLVPWLREQLDSGCYPGVCWLNAERTRFRVPWKHGLRHDAAREDFQLFQVGCLTPCMGYPYQGCVWE